MASKSAQRRAAKQARTAKAWKDYNKSVLSYHKSRSDKMSDKILAQDSGVIVFTASIQTVLRGDSRVLKMSKEQLIKQEQGRDAHIARVVERNKSRKPRKQVDKNPNLKYEVKAKNRNKKAGYVGLMPNAGGIGSMGKNGDKLESIPNLNKDAKLRPLRARYSTGRKTNVYSPSIDYSKKDAGLINKNKYGNSKVKTNDNIRKETFVATA